MMKVEMQGLRNTLLFECLYTRGASVPEYVFCASEGKDGTFQSQETEQTNLQAVYSVVECERVYIQDGKERACRACVWGPRSCFFLFSNEVSS